VAVEKGTKAVILPNLSVFGERTFNNLQTKSLAKAPRKEFFNTHSLLHSLTPVLYLLGLRAGGSCRGSHQPTDTATSKVG
jgi:hypothetical protein